MQSEIFNTTRTLWYESVQTFPGESAPVGAKLEVSMDGGASLNDTSMVCQVLVETEAVGKSMRAAFSGPYDQHITVYNGPTMVYSGTSIGQPLVTFAHWPQHVRQEVVASLPREELHFETPSPISVDGLPVGSGDRIVIDPESPGQTPVTTFSRHRIRMMQLDSIQVRLRMPSTIVASAGSGAFGPPSSVSAGAGPLSAAIADLNADGNADVVLANSNANTVSVLPGNGAGGLGPKTDLTTGAEPWNVAVGDVTGDGVPDLVVADHAASKISLLPGQGAGAFGSAIDYTTAAFPAAVAIADVNGDGNRDVLVACAGITGPVSVLLANGAGGLGTKTDYATGNGPTGIAVGDVNGDGRPDIVVANSASNTVSLLDGDGHGGFGPRTDFTVGSEPRSVALADLDLDGLPDLVVADHGGGTVSVRKGIGPGSFGPLASFPAGGSPLHLSAADLNGDEMPDVAIAKPASGTVSILYGDGSGGFISTSTVLSGAHPNAVVLDDISGDGMPDLVIADGDTGGDAAGFAKVVLGVGGSILPPGAIEFGSGADASYSIVPSPGYAITNVLVDGASKGAISSWLFSGVYKPHTITARFAAVAGTDSPTPTPSTVKVEVKPNPTKGARLDVVFSLPTTAQTRLELVDILGRRIFDREFGSIVPGEHAISLTLPSRLTPGLYWIRLSHGGAQETAKVVVVE
jgi:hypothetical protein